jgi:hypothetical protein
MPRLSDGPARPGRTDHQNMTAGDVSDGDAHRGPACVAAIARPSRLIPRETSGARGARGRRPAASVANGRLRRARHQRAAHLGASGPRSPSARGAFDGVARYGPRRGASERLRRAAGRRAGGSNATGHGAAARATPCGGSTRDIRFIAAHPLVRCRAHRWPWTRRVLVSKAVLDERRQPPIADGPQSWTSP